MGNDYWLVSRVQDFQWEGEVVEPLLVLNDLGEVKDFLRMLGSSDENALGESILLYHQNDINPLTLVASLEVASSKENRMFREVELLNPRGYALDVYDEAAIKSFNQMFVR